MMERVCADLGVKYKRNGSIVVGFGEEDRKTLEELLERGRKNGVRELYIAEKEELHAMEPGLAEDADCALVAPTGAIVCPYELTFAAVGNAMDNGAELLLNFEAEKIEEKGSGEDAYYIVEAKDGRKIEARNIVNAAGLYSDAIAKMAGCGTFRITPRRGEYMLLDKTSGNACSRTIFRTPTKMGKGILISPTVDGNLLLGPTSVNIEDKEDLSVTAEGLDRIIAQVRREMPKVNTGSVITSFCGLRAVGDTGDFIINNPKRGFFNAAAIESPGLTSSPAIARYVAELIRESGLEMKKKENYISTRRAYHWFRDLGKEERNKVIAEEPEYGHVICRCENITEGEILNAIRQNPRATDIDGVKMRTRAQMGRCQGGFCGPHIVKMMAEFMGVPILALTKKGKGSFMNIQKTK
jgi:glycerol-3-phosphate dehydrogenase